MAFLRILSLTLLACVMSADFVSGMSCKYEGPVGLEVSLECPTVLMDESKLYCCYDGPVAHCCDFEDFANEQIHRNMPYIIGGAVGALVLLLLICIVCCCCCACCPCYRKRT